MPRKLRDARRDNGFRCYMRTRTIRYRCPYKLLRRDLDTLTE